MDNLQSGIDAFKSGKREDARKYLIAAVKENPKDENAWGWLYQVANNDNERIQCLKKVTAINPNNEKAKQLLNKLIAPPLTPTPAITNHPQKKQVNSSSVPTRKNNQKTLTYSIAIIVSLCLVCLVAALAINIATPSQSTTPMPQVNNTSVAVQTEKPVEKPTEILPPTNTPEPIATLEPHAALKAEIERVLGSGNRNVPRLTALNFDDPEKGAIFINWAINDNLGESLIIFGAKSDATDILKALAQSGIDYTYVILSGSFPMVDQFGNSKESNVVNLTFYKETVGRINWENFLSDNIYNIADEAHVWVAFQDK